MRSTLLEHSASPANPDGNSISPNRTALLNIDRQTFRAVRVVASADAAVGRLDDVLAALAEPVQEASPEVFHLGFQAAAFLLHPEERLGHRLDFDLFPGVGRRRVPHTKEEDGRRVAQLGLRRAVTGNAASHVGDALADLRTAHGVAPQWTLQEKLGVDVDARTQDGVDDFDAVGEVAQGMDEDELFVVGQHMVGPSFLDERPQDGATGDDRLELGVGLRVVRRGQGLLELTSLSLFRGYRRDGRRQGRQLLSGSAEDIRREAGRFGEGSEGVREGMTLGVEEQASAARATVDAEGELDKVAELAGFDGVLPGEDVHVEFGRDGLCPGDPLGDGSDDAGLDGGAEEDPDVAALKAAVFQKGRHAQGPASGGDTDGRLVSGPGEFGQTVGPTDVSFQDVPVDIYVPDGEEDGPVKTDGIDAASEVAVQVLAEDPKSQGLVDGLVADATLAVDPLAGVDAFPALEVLGEESDVGLRGATSEDGVGCRREGWQAL